jgi:PadR family transcriptional regulator PadR
MKTHGQRDLFPGALEMMILRTLKWQPLHGHALAQHIKRTSNDLLQIEEGSLYPALQRPSQGRAGESRMGHLVHKPSRSDLQIDTDRCEAS